MIAGPLTLDVDVREPVAFLHAVATLANLTENHPESAAAVAALLRTVRIGGQVIELVMGAATDEPAADPEHFRVLVRICESGEVRS